MKEEIISIETAKKLADAEKNEKIIKEAIEYIEKTCTYDKHLMGYCRGLKTGEVKTLVYKLGGRNDRENIR